LHNLKDSIRFSWPYFVSFPIYGEIFVFDAPVKAISSEFYRKISYNWQEQAENRNFRPISSLVECHVLSTNFDTMLTTPSVQASDFVYSGSRSRQNATHQWIFIWLV